MMKVLARACGHSHLSDFTVEDLATPQREMADLSGVAFAGGGFLSRPSERRTGRELPVSRAGPGAVPFSASFIKRERVDAVRRPDRPHRRTPP